MTGLRPSPVGPCLASSANPSAAILAGRAAAELALREGVRAKTFSSAKQPPRLNSSKKAQAQFLPSLLFFLSFFFFFKLKGPSN